MHSICAGEPVSFTLQVRPARNYPLDVYFLMDLSASMANDLTNLQNLASQIGMLNPRGWPPLLKIVCDFMIFY